MSQFNLNGTTAANVSNPATGMRAIWFDSATSTFMQRSDAGADSPLGSTAVANDRLFADDTTVAPASAGAPTVAEITTFLGGSHTDKPVYYTGDDTSTSTPTYAYWVDASGVVTELLSPGGGGGASKLTDLSDVSAAAVTNLLVLSANGTSYLGVALTAAHIQSGTFADARISQSSVTQHVGAIDHDALLNFAINEHIDHTSVSITAGEGLTGGGDISATRNLDVDLSEFATVTALAATDHIPSHDGTGNEKITFQDFFDSISNLATDSETGAASQALLTDLIAVYNASNGITELREWQKLRRPVMAYVVGNTVSTTFNSSAATISVYSAWVSTGNTILNTDSSTFTLAATGITVGISGIYRVQFYSYGDGSAGNVRPLLGATVVSTNAFVANSGLAKGPNRANQNNSTQVASAGNHIIGGATCRIVAGQEITLGGVLGDAAGTWTTSAVFLSLEFISNVNSQLL